MRNAFSSTLGTSTESEPAFFPWQQRLLPLLEEARKRALQRGQAILVSVSGPLATGDRVPSSQRLRQSEEAASDAGRTSGTEQLTPLALAGFDPLQCFALGPLLGYTERFYWQEPGEGRILVGLGRAISLEAQGTQRFRQLAGAWQHLTTEALVEQVPLGVPLTSSQQPLLFGGFAFDPEQPRSDLWEGFPDGLLVLPAFLFTFAAPAPTLTINVLVGADADPLQIGTTTLAQLEALAEALTTASSPAFSPPAAPAASTPSSLHCEPLLPPAAWMELVAQAVSQIRRGAYEKVVLARAVRLLRQYGRFEPEPALRRLRESYQEAYLFAFSRADRCFLGATPERLVEAQDGFLETMALAGSAPRGRTPEEDEHFASELLQSRKNQSEHRIVVQMLRQALEHLCTEIETDPTPHLRRLKNIQHLETRITGKLPPGRSVLEALEELHPTPAVGGFPRAAALAAIRANERLDRGWYAAPIGWVDAAGNGTFAVALRSALIRGQEATLFAGGGIVADSDPVIEYAETRWKFRAMLGALGVEENHDESSF
ncbi:isochorismate synthase [Thermogemmatispora sp.]|uniref:isochorismate synthase n=1 Tax=Thermogemmatispora sp. TaxID=1968838 RepID=UPI001DC1C390|nr:isochorismate synthase [Thermogemmatispora sp.]MBX5449437.1 isochorismate synthase [Thermogemmatispora sp.]